MSEYAWLEKACGMYDSGNQRDGDILSHAWLLFALDIPKPKNLIQAEEIQWLALARIEAFKEWLLVERKTVLKSVRGKGYWIVPPEEQAQVAAEEAMKLVQKGLERGSRMMEYARMEAMDNDARKRHTDTQVRLLGVGQMMKIQKRDVLRLFKPT